MIWGRNANVPGKLRSFASHDRGHWLLICLAAALYFWAHTSVASDLRYAGHADPSYYFELSKSLAGGDGFGVPFTWHFLNHPGSVRNLPNDYWMPLPSILMAGPIRLFGPSVSSAVLVPLAAAATVPFVAYALAREVLEDRPLALAVALSSLTIPVLSAFSVVPDGTALLALVGTGTLGLTIAARKRRSWLLFAGAGASAAIAMLLRQDGALLTLSIAAAILTVRPLTMALRCGATAAVAFLVTISPVALMNRSELGSPLPTVPRRVPWITEYEELYAFGSRLTPDRYFSLGARSLLEQRFDATSDAVSLFFQGFNSPLIVLAITGVAMYGLYCSPARTDLLILMVFPASLFAVQVLVFPVLLPGGGIAKSAPTGIIALLIAAAAGYREAPHRGARSLMRGGAFVAVSFLLLNHLDGPTSRVESANEAGRHLGRTAVALNIADDSRVMTRVPWEFTSSTGIESVMIPFEDGPGIMEIACRLDVRYIIESETRDTDFLVRERFARRAMPGVLEVVGC